MCFHGDPEKMAARPSRPEGTGLGVLCVGPGSTQTPTGAADTWHDSREAQTVARNGSFMMVLFGEAERCRRLQGWPEGPGGPGSSAEVQAQVGRSVPLSPPFSV